MCDDGPFGSSREMDAWREAVAAQRDGDHAVAEELFARVARADPSDAEARFQQAIEAGWSAPAGGQRFDEVLVGIASALERASSSDERSLLRRRAARALTVLGEMRFARSQDHLVEVGSAERNEALVHHLMLGSAVLRMLDSAVELEPYDSHASEAIVRVCDDLLARVGPRGLRIAGLGFVGRATPVEGHAVGRARERALRHLAALARSPRPDETPSDRETLSSDDRVTAPHLALRRR